MNFSTILIDWYEINKRDLPWRNTCHPYEIWVSEIILQQTRIEQGLPYYLSFLAHFPTVDSLANANLDEVLKVWQGLGYYSRARNMHAAANQILADNNGIFPESHTEILKLKGVGKYTAAAISSFAFKESIPVVDGNVIRFISRYLGIYDDMTKRMNLNKIETFVSSEIQKTTNPDIFNQSIMEFGALLCTPQNPNCKKCPYNIYCRAFLQDKIPSTPFFPKKSKKQKRFLNYIHFIIQKENTQYTLIHRRLEKDIWQNLYELPLLELANAKKSDISNHFSLSEFATKKLRKHSQTKHLLTHRELHITIWECPITPHDIQEDIAKRYKMISQQQISKYAFPIPLVRYFEQKNENADDSIKNN
jgi:A/G-specific adenine glycosylase